MTISWMRHRRWYYAFSGLLLTLSVIGILIGGLKPALEFTGGTQLIVQAPAVPAEVFQPAGKEAAEQVELEVPSILPLPNDEYEFSLPTIDNTKKEALLKSLRTVLPQNEVYEVSFQTVGPSVGKELVNKTLIGIGLAVAVILGYLWLQFRDWRFGFAGVLAMLHDTLIVTGAFAWLGLLLDVKVDVLFVTAVLTILSFSVHDTIVIFDRLRELRRTTRSSDSTLELADRAVSQTLTRSLNNSITILVMLAALLLLGGESLRWFTAALFIGTLVGTYSSSFMALPLYVDLVRWESGQEV